MGRRRRTPFSEVYSSFVCKSLTIDLELESTNVKVGFVTCNII
jgi:hypothetical protein